MKIYEPKSPFLIRVSIRKQGEKTEHMTFCETNVLALMLKLKQIIGPHLTNPFTEGKKTAVDLRESEDSKNGKSKSFSFIGLEPSEVRTIIVNHFNINT